MASSRRSPPADADPIGESSVAAVNQAIRRAFAPFARDALGREARIAIALSGGRDSMVLLDASIEIARALGIALRAVHVHHGLSSNADAWARFCAEQCARRAIALDVHRVDVARGGDGLEANARRVRYDVLATLALDAVALAHHADDQAETLLLQLVRGAGPHGLAAMAPAKIAGGTTFIRPLLSLPRGEIERYARARALEWVDDESNADRARTRNRIRHDVAPRLAAASSGYPMTVARAAEHQAEAARLLDELALQDAAGALADGALERGRLASLSPHRARNLLRWFLRTHGLRAPSSARLAAMLDQLAGASRDARVRLRHDGAEIGVHRDRVVVHAAPCAPFAIAWRGERELSLPHGTLEFAQASGEGLAADLAHANGVVVRSREGGERLRLVGRTARTSLKQLMQRAGIPHWARGDVPLVYCGDSLAAVPGIGIDAAFAAAAGSPGYALNWRPHVVTDR